MKHKEIIFFFLLLLTPVYAGNYLNFTETFGTGAFNYSNCEVRGGDFYSYNNYLLGTTISEFNHTWKCIFNTADGLMSLTNNTPKAQTDTSLKITSGIHSANDVMSIAYISDMVIDKFTSFEFYCAEFDNTDEQEEIYLILGNETGVEIAIALNPVTGSECNWQAPSNCCDNTAGMVGVSCDGANPVKINITLQGIFQICQNWNISEIDQVKYDINYVAWAFTGDDYASYIDDFSIKNVINGTNTLPSCNVTQDYKSRCADSSGYATFSIDVDCYDLEGDTIYYSLDQESYDPRYLYIDADFSHYTFFNNDYFFANDTLIDNLQDTQMWQLGYPQEPSIFLGGSQGTYLLLSSFGTDAFGFGLEHEVSNTTSSLYNLHFFNDTKLEVEYWSGSGEKSVLSINYTDGRLLIASDNSLIINITGIESWKSNGEFITISTILVDGLNLRHDISKDSGSIYLGSTSELSGLKYIAFKSKDTYVNNDDYFGISYFSMKGWFLVETAGNWSTTYNSNLTLTEGDYRYKLFTSDYWNYPQDYEDHDLWFTVYDYEGCTDLSSDIDDLLTLSKRTTGDSFKNYLIKLGIYEKAKKFIWVLYLMLLIFFSIGSYKLLHRPKIFESNLIASMICFIPCFFADMTAMAISFLVFSSLSLAIIVAGDVGGRNG